MKKFIFLIALIIIVGGLAGFIFVRLGDSGNNQDKSELISSYEQCAAAGYPVQASYPTVCRTPDGQSFTNPNQAVPAPEAKIKEEAIDQAKNYQPPADISCTQALVPAVHKATGAQYTFSNGCLAPGWEAEN